MSPEQFDALAPLPDYYEVDPSNAAVGAGDLPGQSAFEGPQMKSAEILDVQIQVIKVRKLTSTKSKDGYFYVAQCRNVNSGELFSTALGGSAVLKTVDTWLRTKPTGPLMGTLREVKGGKYGKYHVFE